MADEGGIRTLERMIVRSGTITTRALAEVHPEVRGLTVSQYRVFALVADTPDGLRVTELARRSSSRMSATSKIVKRLETHGLVWAERGVPPDKRVVVVRLTDAGGRTWAEISTRRQELLGAALTGIELPTDTVAGLEVIADAFERFTA